MSRLALVSMADPIAHSPSPFPLPPVGHPSIRLTRGGSAGREWMAADAAGAVSE